MYVVYKVFVRSTKQGQFETLKKLIQNLFQVHKFQIMAYIKVFNVRKQKVGNE